MKKNILIAGASRAGKSTLARQLAKSLGYSFIPIDAIVSAFQDTFPQIDIRHINLDWHDICKNLFPFLDNFLHELRLENCSFVADTFHITPELANKLKERDNLEIIFLGYPNISPDKKIFNIRTFPEEHDWTKDLSDQELLNSVNILIKRSQELEQECKKFDLKFYDTGDDFSLELAKIHKEILAKIN